MCCLLHSLGCTGHILNIRGTSYIMANGITGISWTHGKIQVLVSSIALLCSFYACRIQSPVRHFFILTLVLHATVSWQLQQWYGTCYYGYYVLIDTEDLVELYCIVNVNQIGTLHCIPALRRIGLLLLIVFLHPFGTTMPATLSQISKSLDWHITFMST